MHNCLICEHSDRFQKPISLTTGNHVHLLFTCTSRKLPNVYGTTGVLNTMVFDLVDEWCHIDGGQSIDKTGCDDFKCSLGINKEVLNPHSSGEESNEQ